MMQDWLAGLVGEDVAPILFVLLAALFVALLAVVVIRLLRGVLSGGIGLGKSDGPRVEVVDVTAVDPKRKLVLVRRDQVEHLILIGGANDLVIESRIGRPAPPPPRRLEPDAVPVPAPAAVASVAPAPVPQGAARRAEPPSSALPVPKPAAGAANSARADAPLLPTPVEPAPVRAPLQPRPQASDPASPPTSAKGRDESGRDVVPDAAFEPRPVQTRDVGPQVRAPAADERLAAGDRPDGKPVREAPIPTVAPASERAGSEPALQARPSVPSTREPNLPATPVVEPQLVAPERRTSAPPPPLSKGVAEPAKIPDVPARSAPVRHALPDWPVRDAVETPAADRPKAPPVASPTSPPPVSPIATPSTGPGPSDERPLVVRSFASTIGERRSGPVGPTPPLAATPPVISPASPGPAAKADDVSLDDDFLADLSRQLEMPDEPGNEISPLKDDTTSGVSPRREMSLEDEMQRLLRDFSAHTGDRR